MPYSEKSLLFDGVSNYVTMGDVLGFDRTDPFSISAWIKVGAGGGSFVSKMETTGTIRGYDIGIDEGDSFRVTWILRHDQATLDRMFIKSTTTGLNDGQWHHVVVTWDGDVAGGVAGANIYLDGALDTPITVTDGLTGTLLNSIPFNISGRNNGVAEVYSGGIDEVAVYDKELSADEVAQLYNGGWPADLGAARRPSGLVGWWRMGDGDTFPTLRGRSRAPALQVSELLRDLARPATGDRNGAFQNMEDADITSDVPGDRHGYSTTFGGTDEYINFGNVYTFDYDDPFSFSVWTKLAVGSGGGCVISKIQGGGSMRGYIFRLYPTVVVMQLLNESFYAIQVNVDYIDDGAWHHIVVTWDGDASPGAAGVVFYIDGVLATPTVVFDLLGSRTITNVNNFNIGRRDYFADQYFVGSIDEVSVYTKALSASEASDIYNGGTPTDNLELSSEPNLYSYWGMGETEPYEGTMSGLMAAEDIVTDAPDPWAFQFATPVDSYGASFTVLPVPPGVTMTFTDPGGGGPPAVISYYKMRAQDDGVPAPGYVTWIATTNPDFAGTGFPGGAPAPVGNMVPGTAVIADEWEE